MPCAKKTLDADLVTSEDTTVRPSSRTTDLRHLSRASPWPDRIQAGKVARSLRRENEAAHGTLGMAGVLALQYHYGGSDGDAEELAKDGAAFVGAKNSRPER